jgi:hypothetical protein
MRLSSGKSVMVAIPPPAMSLIVVTDSGGRRGWRGADRTDRQWAVIDARPGQRPQKHG